MKQEWMIHDTIERGILITGSTRLAGCSGVAMASLNHTPNKPSLSHITEVVQHLPHLQSPARLARIAARCIVLNPGAIGTRVTSAAQNGWCLDDHVLLPGELGDLLLAECRALASCCAATVTSTCLQLLASKTRTRVSHCDVRALCLDAAQLVALTASRPRVLCIDSHIKFSDQKQLQDLRDCTSQVRHLWIGNRCAEDTVFVVSAASGELMWPHTDEESGGGGAHNLPVTFPRLLSFVLHGSPSTGLNAPASYVSALISAMPRLTHLEISNVYREMDVTFVAQLRQLRVLVLHNVCLSSLQPLWQCSRLRYLDISVPGGRQPRSWPDPDAQLASLMLHLPLLEHLDIACTNLAGSGAGDSDGTASAACDIVGLACRVDRPLKYLNIYGCSASHRARIPAKQVGGEVSEKQVLAACAPHTHHSLMMLELLDQMEALLQMNQQVECWRRMLHLALDTAARFDYLKDVHIRCAAVVQNVVSSRSILCQLTELERQRVLGQVFRSVGAQRRSVRLRHFAVLILMNFEVPHDMLFNFSGYVDTLYYMLSGVLGERENFVERVLIFLLNKTCCEVDGGRKELIGRRGLIKVLLRAIQSRCVERNCDEVMRFLWSCLWNVTDETPYNCQMFLENRGLRLFCECLRNFRDDQSDLVRNMMGLMGNIAEVSELRASFFTSACMSSFCDMLADDSLFDLEVSYHAGGVLANLLSDSTCSWTLQAPSRQQASSTLQQAVCRWNVLAERAINYRSLRPIIKLLDCSQSASQLWAAWALANLSHTLPQRYAVMVCDEGGVTSLQRLINAPVISEQQCHHHLVHLASLCLRSIDSVSHGGRSHSQS